jgi:hypothetical protein
MATLFKACLIWYFFPFRIVMIKYYKSGSNVSVVFSSVMFAELSASSSLSSSLSLSSMLSMSSVKGPAPVNVRNRSQVYILLLNGIFVVQRIQPFQVVSFELAFNSSKSKLRMELATVNLINSKNWSRILVDNLAASLLPGL